MGDEESHAARQELAKKFLAMSFEKRAELYTNDSSTTEGLLEIALCGKNDGCDELWKAIEKLEHESSRQFAEQFVSSSVEERLLCSPQVAGRAFYHIMGCLGSIECEEMREQLLLQENLDPHVQALVSRWNSEMESHEPFLVAREFKRRQENPFWTQRN